MNFKRLLKNQAMKVRFFSYLYWNVYVKYLEWKRFNVSIYDLGKNNIVELPKNTFSSDFRITIRGGGNTIKVGTNCQFLCTNNIYIQGDGNTVEIGDNVIFDQNVSIVLAEGTKVSIGSGCRLANGVRIRTSDQHFIYEKDGTRINYAKNVQIGNHVWLGASCVVMKGVNIGNGTVVGMNSMVTKNIPPNSIAVGTPARVIKSNIHWIE